MQTQPVVASQFHIRAMAVLRRFPYPSRYRLSNRSKATMDGFCTRTGTRVATGSLRIIHLESFAMNTGTYRWTSAIVALCLLATAVLGDELQDQSSAYASRRERSDAASYRFGGSFEGTFAYDSAVGYDYGFGDDNGHLATFYRRNRGKMNRMPGKRPDPGDFDYADFYYQAILTNGSLQEEGTGSARESQGTVSRWHARGSSAFVPLRYDDFSAYQRFQYRFDK
jgi:hypothetical protein